MTSSVTEPYTDEQADLIDLPVGARALVDAAAGTGKTHVLAGRLARLVERDELSVGDELLVLSFSRAAVSELRSRVRRLGGDARYAGSFTFDSFATRLLDTEDPNGSWSNAGYDIRIRAAVDLLGRPDTPQVVSLVRHILVDEVQDLVGARASFVMALLERHDGGFTIFGDPAQAIYGHQVDERTDGPTNAKLYDWLDDKFEGCLSRCTLTRDFRGRTKYSDDVADIGRRLRQRNRDDADIGSRIRTLLLRLPTTSIAGARHLLTRENDGTSAILCRTNAEALRLSRELFGRDIRHRFQRRGQDKAAPRWLSVAAAGAEMRTTRSALMPRLEKIAEENGITADDLFLLLRKLAPGRGDVVDFMHVANRIRDSSFPEDLNEVPAASVVVSTIHRAKGLEFERVFLCQPQERSEGDVDEENRILYVALTRPRSEIFHLPRPETIGLHIDRPSGRWIRKGFGPNQRRVFELEVFGSDSDSVHPPGTRGFEEDAISLQRYLVDEVAAGDQVELLRSHGKLLDGEVPTFIIRHRNRSIGVTSDEFGSDLIRALGAKRRLPSSICDLHIEMVDTVAGDALWGRRFGLGPHGLWARARVFGLGSLNFDGGAAEGE